MSRDDWKTMAINLQQEVNRLRGLLGRRVVVNHRVLLRKYIRYIEECEGINYISRPQQSYVEFTDAEWAELKRLARHRSTGS